MWSSARSCVRVLVLAYLAAMPPAASAQGTGPLAPYEEASLQQIRDFVRATAERYRMVAPLEISVASWVGSSSVQQYASSPAVYTRGGLYLNRPLLRATNRVLVITTALGYEILRAPSKATSLADRERERAQIALEGKAKAVDIPVQVKGLSESEALEQMYAWLLAIHRAAAASGRPAQPGSMSACDAIRDLLGRFPGVREKFVGQECAPAYRERPAPDQPASPG
jgi:hypothetical protein